jgi:hypothetical protein
VDGAKVDEFVGQKDVRHRGNAERYQDKFLNARKDFPPLDGDMVLHVGRNTDAKHNDANAAHLGRPVVPHDAAGCHQGETDISQKD